MNIKVTSDAIAQLKDRYNNADRAFRVMINGFGWGGPVFGIVLDEQLEGDHLEETYGIKFVVNEDLLSQFGTFTIDYISNFFRKGMVVTSSHGGGNC